MIDSYIRLSFILLMSISAIGIVVLIPLLYIQHLIHRKTLDPIYFNKKYYSDYELHIFKTFPLLLVKTLGYIKAITFPKAMRRKFKHNIIKPEDNILIATLAWLTILILIIGGLVLINTGISAIFHYNSI